ncbi:hypothetical protein [Actinomadura rubrisoli]|uniref:hypothetical protein n=1 Tax=Actinomadura rubrisoli TaxID=2530368 RepID=UPI001A9F2F39|nr:hypothetical protein [Actinomadura rubrisoli]
MQGRLRAAVRSVRSAGASWSQIGAALGMGKQAAWEAHGKWIDGQAARNREAGYQGLDRAQVEAVDDFAGQAHVSRWLGQ